MAESLATSGLPKRAQVHAVAAGFLGLTLDAFDFFVVIFMLDVLAERFHVPKAAIVATLTATLATRPLGAFIFGLLADRYGRRIPLMANVIFFSVIELLCGFSPNYTVFFILRTLYGIGMGGEWGERHLLFRHRAALRVLAELHRVLHSAHAVRHRHGRRVGRGRVAGHGDGAAAMARRAERHPAIGILDWISSRGRSGSICASQSRLEIGRAHV